MTRTVKQPYGCTQSPLSSAFSIIIPLSGSLYRAVVLSNVLKRSVWRAVRVRGDLWDPSALANNLHESEDCVHHQCEVKSVHLALPMTC